VEFACVHGSNFYQQKQGSPLRIQGTNQEELDQPLLLLGSMEHVRGHLGLCLVSSEGLFY